MTQKPASKERIRDLYKNMGLNFRSFVPLLSIYTGALENLEQIQKDESNDVNVLSLYKKLLKLQIFNLIINLDLSGFLRANFRSTSNSEKRCNLKHINVITIEGYNYLFGFGKDKDNAIFSIIKNLAEQLNEEELIKDINTIEQIAKEFENTFATRKDRDHRNLAIHYDSDPIKVYSLLSQISEATETIRTCSFLNILDTLSVFTSNYIKKFEEYQICSNINYEIDVYEKINRFTDLNNKLFNLLDKKLVHFAEQLDNIVNQCKVQKIIQENFDNENIYSDSFKLTIESIYPSIHIFFIYLDLASAVRAYLSSEFYFEKQLNLRRINIVVYEGFKHLYGYSEKDHNNSFWQRNIISILNNSTNHNHIDSLNKIENMLKELASDKGINNMLLRECSVHYRYKERDNIVTLFHALVKSSPLMEMKNSLKLLNLLPQLININSECVDFNFSIQQEKVESSNKKTITQIDKILCFIEDLKIDSEKKQELLNNFNKVKKFLV